MEVLGRLGAICGDEHVRGAEPADAVDGVPARYVVTPGSTDEVADVLRLAGAQGLRTVVRGHGSKLGWGCPPTALELIIDTARLARLIEHAAGDLIAIVEPGLALADLQRELAGSGQRLALDDPRAAGTLGGAVAAAASGPCRLRYGTPRDLVIGITVVLADGTVAAAGGKVVKNVAGYDLGKLYTGSLGTLGVITRLAVRLHPLGEARRVVSVSVTTPADAGELVRAVTAAQLVPSAVELDWPELADAGVLSVLFEGATPGVEAQAATCARLLGHPGDVDTDLPQGWGRHPFAAGEFGFKLTMLPTGMPEVLAVLNTATARLGLRPRVRGQAATGVLYAGLPADADPAAVGTLLTDIRAVTGRHGGGTVILDAPTGAKHELDVWGPVSSLALMRRVKDRFDPDHLLAPGRYVGDI